MKIQTDKKQMDKKINELENNNVYFTDDMLSQLM